MQIWQSKLSLIKVAQFPWDPTPATSSQQPAASQPTAVKAQPASDNATPVPTPPPATSMQAPVKQEIKTESSSRPMPQATYNSPQLPPNSMANMTAQQRAAAALQQKFGQQAAPQISQLQGQSGYQPKPPAPGSAPYQSGQDVKPPLSALQQMHQAQSSNVRNGQTDGAGDPLEDWKAEVARRRAEAANISGESDRLIREHFLEMQQRLEGGGLLMPLEERYYPKTSVKRKVNALAAESSATAISSGPSSTATQPPIQQFDGGDEDDDDDTKVKDDDEDEDAINSDLDDPDELAGDPEADAETDEAMLCTYEKVQRVKNKWKCTLKDGILKVDGKE